MPDATKVCNETLMPPTLERSAVFVSVNKADEYEFRHVVIAFPKITGDLEIPVWNYILL